MLKIKIIKGVLNTRAYVEDRPDIKPGDCTTLYSAIGRLIYGNQKAFNVEVKDNGRADRKDGR